jgi:type I restriction enzyme S subunit
MSLVKSPKEIIDEAEASGSAGLLARHGSWERIEIGKVATIQNGAPFSSTLFNTRRKGFPIIRIRDVGKNEISTWFDGEFSVEYVVQFGDLLIGMDGDFRSSRWLGEPALLNQRVCRLVVTDERVLQAFIEYALPGYLDAIAAETSSITVKHLSSKSIQQILLPLPPFAEQERIVEILEEQFSRLDGALASIKAVRQKSQAFRRSLLHSAFSGDLTTVDKHLELKKLQDLVLSRSDITDGPFGSNLKSSHYVSAGPRVVRLANIGSGVFVDAQAHITSEHFETLRKHEVVAGDVLVASLGEDIPRACIAPESLGEAIVKADCIRIRPAPNVSSQYLAFALNSPQVRANALANIQGVTRPRINLGALRSTSIPIPDYGEQQRIVTILEQQFSRLDNALEITNRLEARIASERRSLLHATFSGELTAQWRETHV